MNADIVLWNLASLKVGAAAAFLQSGVFNWGRYWLLFGSSFLVITWLNLRFAIDTILLFHFKARSHILLLVRLLQIDGLQTYTLAGLLSYLEYKPHLYTYICACAIWWDYCNLNAQTDCLCPRTSFSSYNRWWVIF